MITSFQSVEVAVELAAVAAGAPLLQLLPPQAVLPSGVKSKAYGLVRLRFVLKTAVATELGLVVPATVGTALTSHDGVAVTSFAAGDGDAINSDPLGKLVEAWTVAPTFAVTPAYFERDLLPATIGAGFEWTWPEDDPFVPFFGSPLHAGNTGGGKGVVVQNIGAGATGVLLVSARWKMFGEPPP